jgi:hypothetical protein
MKRLLLFIFSLAVIAMAEPVMGQDSLQSRRAFGPEIWVDYGKIALYATEFESKLEGGFLWRFGKIAPVFIAGYSQLTPSQAIKNGEYTSEGYYFRTGLEYFLSINRKNRLILGLRYALAEFEDDGNYVISSDLWPDETGFFQRSDLSASWAELIIGSEMTLSESRWIAGGYFSLRAMIDRDEFDLLDIYAIPGYGRTTDKTIPALQLYIKFSLAN